jgi:hypothetical protein
MDQADLPGRTGIGGDVRAEALERAVRRSLRGEDPAVDDDVASGQVDLRPVGVEDGDHVVVRAAA